MTLTNPDEQTFESIIKEKKFVIAKFFGTWCGPCKMLSFLFDSIIEKYEDKITFVNIDIDKEPALSEKYDVRMVPTLFFIENGKVIHKIIGFIPSKIIEAKINEVFFDIKTEEVSRDDTYDIIIIGAGSAGLTAALYASRTGLKSLIIESFAPGGKMLKTFEVNNWPGIRKTGGAELAFSFYEHAMDYGSDYTYETVTNIVNQKDFKEVICESGNIYKAPAIIIASGTKERLLNIPGEAEMIGRGISFCAVCDGAFYRDKTVVVVGGGNSALEESLHLTQFAKKVIIISRRDTFRAEEYIQKSIAQNEKIEVISNFTPQKVIIQNDKIIALEIKSTLTNETKTVDTDGIFPFIGADPNTAFINDSLGIKDENGYMLVDKHMSTFIPGIFAAGDVCVKNLRQIVTATNDGAIAAESAFAYLRKN